MQQALAMPFGDVHWKHYPHVSLSDEAAHNGLMAALASAEFFPQEDACAGPLRAMFKTYDTGSYIYRVGNPERGNTYVCGVLLCRRDDRVIEAQVYYQP